uniref:Xaa-Pro aminopeptidase 1 n=1 Tax=Parasteatoda tepidariorum TaxID=114398 RepID=A0A2L2Y8C0_PARTP
MTRRCSTEILKKFRDVMKNSEYVTESLQAYIIPSVDAHQSEYIAPCDKRIQFISGFTGSRGTAVITEKHAALWTDGRYFLQANQQLDENWTLMKERIEGTPSVGEWLNDVLPNGSKVGFDSFLLDNDTWKTLKETFESSKNCLVPTEKNLVDVIWEDKPSIPSNSVDFLPIKYSGKGVEEKISEVRNEMIKQKASILVITALDEVAWLFNLRGSDIVFNPVFFSYAIVTLDSLYLFIDSKKLSETAKNSLSDLKNLNLQILPYENVVKTLKELFKEKKSRVWFNQRTCYGIVSLIPKEYRFMKTTPVEMLKSIKNDVEINGARIAHIKDGAALSEFFHWLTLEISTGNLTEISAADKLEDIKKDLTDYVGLSFGTISASGPNAAIIHYQPSKETNRKLDPSEIYLCDCGTQYRDGTTDVTRTWHFGEPTPMEIKSYTLVLKGHIAVTRAIFPAKCTGHRIDSFARKFLWDYGLDYLHGTGHGVGSFLNVHEGPCGISLCYRAEDPGIQSGMILSIEPGYYEDNKFGIRLENLAVAKKAETDHNFGDKEYLTFEPLTVFPFQAKLIDTSLLTSDEVSWLNNYHMLCLEKVGGYLKELGKHDALKWLKDATIPIKNA